MISSCQKVKLNPEPVPSIAGSDYVASVQAFLNIPGLGQELENGIIPTSCKRFYKTALNQLWIISLKPGTYGFAKAKIAASLQNGKFSMIIISYNYDTHLYKPGNFNTYTGSITVYNQSIQIIAKFDFEKGVLKNFYTPEPTPPASIMRDMPSSFDYTDWCTVYPPLCNYSGGGDGQQSTIDMLLDPNYDISGGGGSSTLPAVDYIDENVTNPAVSIIKIFNCFNIIPDAGATYTVNLCVDIPVNGYPLLPIQSVGDVGHTFLSITKSNGTQSITQSFGFYPTTWINLLGGFVPSKIVDNGAIVPHEYNAKMAMSMNQAQFTQLKQNAINYSSFSYNLIWRNCTDYALAVFNSIRTSPIGSYPIVVPFYNFIPNNPPGLYRYLEEIKTQGGPEANNIETNLNVSPPSSHGECN